MRCKCKGEHSPSGLESCVFSWIAFPSLSCEEERLRRGWNEEWPSPMLLGKGSSKVFPLGSRPLLRESSGHIFTSIHLPLQLPELWGNLSGLHHEKLVGRLEVVLTRAEEP